MFNKFIKNDLNVLNSVSMPNKIVVKAEITENKAPTEESARFYKEVYETVCENILYSEKGDSNTFDYKCIIFAPPMSLQPPLFCLITVINGRKYEFKKEFPKIVRKVSIEHTVDGPIYKYDLDNDEIHKLIFYYLSLSILEEMQIIKPYEFDNIYDSIKNITKNI